LEENLIETLGHSGVDADTRPREGPDMAAGGG
jgi:hypothetical protein